MRTFKQAQDVVKAFDMVLCRTINGEYRLSYNDGASTEMVYNTDLDYLVKRASDIFYVRLKAINISDNIELGYN
jgi:hypothetical protein